MPAAFTAPMIITLLMKIRFISTLFILLISLHISSCSTEENNATDTADIYLDPNTDTGADNSHAYADINLSWVAPAEREANSSISLSQIAGFQVFYGMSHGDYYMSILIYDGSAVNYTLTDPSRWNLLLRCNDH